MRILVPVGPGSSRAVRHENDLAVMRPLFHASVRVRGLGERKDAIDPRPDLPRRPRRRRAPGTRGRWPSSSPGSRAASRRSAGSPPSGFGPEVAPQVTIRPPARGRLERRHPRRLADRVDDDVDAALAGVRAARPARRPPSRVVDDELRAGLAQRGPSSPRPKSSRRRARRRAARSPARRRRRLRRRRGSGPSRPARTAARPTSIRQAVW